MNKFTKIFIIMIAIFLSTGCIDSLPIWIMDIINPSNNLIAKEGSLFLNTSTFNLYKKDTEQWKSIGNILATDLTVNMYVDEDGYVVINGETTKINLKGIKGQKGDKGVDGKTPKITTSKDGFLVIDGKKTILKVKTTNKICNLVNDVDKNNKFSIGDEINCGTEYFYVMEFTEDDVTLLSKYNLDVGNIYNIETNTITEINPVSVKQNNKAIGTTLGKDVAYGTIEFSQENYWDKNDELKMLYMDDQMNYHNIYDSNSFLFNYIKKY